MPELIPACFRGGAAAARPPEEGAAAAAGPSLTTSVYETRLGLVSLSWSRNALGLSLLAELRLRDGDGDDDDADADEEEPLAFRIRPWLFWKRRGSKRFRLGDRRGGDGPQSVELAWDLTRARFPPGGAPEPAGGYFVAVAVDGEAALVAGDLRAEAYKRARSAPRGEALLISRREHVAMRRDARTGVRSYATSARFGGKEREITITLTSKEKEKEREKEKEKERKGKVKGKGEDMAMSIAVDGSRVLHVRRLRWKFRGSDTVDVDSSPVQISWDLHSWLFPPRGDANASAAAAAAAPPPPPPPPPPPRAVFVFRFEREPTPADPKTKCEGEASAPGKKWGSSLGGYGGVVGEYLGKLSRRNWSESSSCGGDTTTTRGRRRRRTKKKKKSLLKTSSSSSTASSTASTISGSTVMDWASAEEAELQRGEGFSLLVYALKS